MFVLCPHCQFLVTVDPRSGRPPALCPNCGKPMEGETKAEDAPAALPPEVQPPPETPPVAASEDAPEPTPAPEPEPEPAQLDADAVIAAMAQKSPRKPRATKSAEKPARRKREPATKAEPAPPPAAPPKPAGPSLAVRMAAWWQARKPAPKPKAETPVVAAKSATTEAKPKATVKPVPSLRERAAKRAAQAEALAQEAQGAETPAVETPAVEVPAPATPVAPVAETHVAASPTIEPARVETPPIEFIPLAQTPVEAALAVDTLLASIPEVVAPPPAPAPTPTASPEAVEPEAPPTVAATPSVVPQPPALSPAPKPRATTAAPSFARRRAGLRGAMPARWTSLATIGALALLLVLQLLLAQRDALAENARWRPTMSALCGVLRCTLPAWREPEAFTMLSRDVRPHPVAAGTLQIDASFRNDARWPQAWPRLVVSLSDIDGRVLGTRAFTAREYLGETAATQTTLGPGQTAAVSLSVVEPAPGVVAFSFEFR